MVLFSLLVKNFTAEISTFVYIFSRSKAIERIRGELLRLLNRLLGYLHAAVLLTGCGPGGGSSVATNSDLQTPSVGSGVDTSDEMFVPNQVLDIDIQMDAGDYDVMRIEGRSLPRVFSG
ncbi:uncharacterized protein METZ01_LOCUS469609, partial [marine metagenome]